MKVIGCIVFNRQIRLGLPLQLFRFEGGSQRGVLLSGDATTLFASRQAARNAIRRTVRWAQRRPKGQVPPWAHEEHFLIIRVQDG